ncbi:hypothetical protein ACLB2K_033763 [Fragaria x ananassa]
METPTNENNSNNGTNSTSHNMHHFMEMGMDVHKVVLPPYRSTFQKLKAKLKEILFPDDPLHQFKGQTSKQKWILGAQYVFPILEWGPSYSFKLFKSDIVAGLTIASLAIPQGISYAKLANLPPIVGLYSSFVPPLLYAVLGSSRDLAVGPVSIASLIMGSMLMEEVSPTKEPVLFLQLAFTSTFFAGILQASLGFLRLGFIIDFLSKATLIGFMAGAAVIVSLQQLKSLLGIKNFTKKMALVPVLTSVFKERKETNDLIVLMIAVVMANYTHGLLLPCPATALQTHCWTLTNLFGVVCLDNVQSMKKPKMFWVSAGAPLVSVILSTLIVFAVKANNHGISVIGELQKGLNPPSWNMLQFKGTYLGLVIKTGIITGIISLTEGIAVGRTFAAIKDYRVDGNKEMIAIGIMNIVGSSTSCYITTGSFSRSAVNHNAGAKTAMSNIVMSVTVMVTLLFLMPLFQYTPNVILGAIIVTAVIGLIDVPAAYHIWKVDKYDFLVLVCAFVGVIFISVQEGLAIAVGISVFKIMLQVTRPRTVVLGNIPGTDIFRDLQHYKDSTATVPGFLIISIEAAINFANTTYLNERILRWIEEEDDGEKRSSIRYVIIDMTAVSTIDTTGITLFRDLVLVNPLSEVMEKLKKAYEGDEIMRPDALYLTVGEAVASLSISIKNQASNVYNEGWQKQQQQHEKQNVNESSQSE